MNSEDKNEELIETMGDLSVLGSDIEEQLELPSLGGFLVTEALQFVGFIFFYAVLSFIPGLFVLTVNKYLWTKFILEALLHLMAWYFVVFALLKYGRISIGGMKRGKYSSGFWGGWGSIGFIIWVLINILSIGYSIMYLIWGGIDTAKLPSSYQRTWQIILLIIVFIEVIVIIFEIIFLGYYLRRMLNWFRFLLPRDIAMTRAKIVYHTLGNEATKTYLAKTQTKNQINSMLAMQELPTRSFFGKNRWKKNDVSFDITKTGGYI